jgi:uncharacterized protein YgbK (DUF1537 family)
VLVVLDDDPTGTQAVTGVPVLLEWDDELLRRAAEAEPPAIHLLTNARAFPPERAYAIVRGAAEAAARAYENPRFLLRGDSTLRGHLLEEYLALREAAFPDRTPPLLLVPALPAAGRVTRGGVHFLGETPLHETEYARDPAFGYSSARLVEWARERSRGYFAAGREVRPDGVEMALLELAEAGEPAVCVPDAETIDDLASIADALRRAEAAGIDVVVRSAPTFVGVLAGNLARGHVAPPAASKLLVVCGSYVPTTTRQLEHLARERGIDPNQSNG